MPPAANAQLLTATPVLLLQVPLLLLLLLMVGLKAWAAAMAHAARQRHSQQQPAAAAVLGSPSPPHPPVLLMLLCMRSGQSACFQRGPAITADPGLARLIWRRQQLALRTQVRGCMYVCVLCEYCVC